MYYNNVVATSVTTQRKRNKIEMSSSSVSDQMAHGKKRPAKMGAGKLQQKRAPPVKQEAPSTHKKKKKSNGAKRQSSDSAATSSASAGSDSDSDSDDTSDSDADVAASSSTSIKSSSGSASSESSSSDSDNDSAVEESGSDSDSDSPAAIFSDSDNSDASDATPVARKKKTAGKAIPSVKNDDSDASDTNDDSDASDTNDESDASDSDSDDDASTDTCNCGDDSSSDDCNGYDTSDDDCDGKPKIHVYTITSRRLIPDDMNQIRLRVEEVGVGSIEKMRHRIAIIAENCRRDIMKELRQLHGPCENYKPHNFNVLMSQGHYPASCTIIPDGELASEFTYIFEGRVTKRSRQYSMHRIVDATAQAMRKDQRKQAMMKRSMSKALNEKKKGSSASDGN